VVVKAEVVVVQRRETALDVGGSEVCTVDGQTPNERIGPPHDLAPALHDCRVHGFGIAMWRREVE